MKKENLQYYNTIKIILAIFSTWGILQVSLHEFGFDQTVIGFLTIMYFTKKDTIKIIKKYY